MSATLLKPTEDLRYSVKQKASYVFDIDHLEKSNSVSYSEQFLSEENCGKYIRTLSLWIGIDSKNEILMLAQPVAIDLYLLDDSQTYAAYSSTFNLFGTGSIEEAAIQDFFDMAKTLYLDLSKSEPSELTRYAASQLEKMKKVFG